MTKNQPPETNHLQGGKEKDPPEKSVEVHSAFWRSLEERGFGADPQLWI